MKRTVIVLVTGSSLAVAVLLATAQAVEPPEITEEKCRDLHAYAAKVMRARQLDLAAPQVMATADGNGLKELVIRAAYREPLFLTDEYRQRAIQEFANMMYLDCLDASEQGD